MTYLCSYVADFKTDWDAAQRASTYFQLRSFLLECGTRLHDARCQTYSKYLDEAALLPGLTAQMNVEFPTSRV
jgi:hypothetical protein